MMRRRTHSRIGAASVFLLVLTAAIGPTSAPACDIYPADPQAAGGDQPECYAPDEFVATGGSGDYSEGERSDSIRNGLYQRWMWCGTSCWLLINDVDKELVVFDGYVSKATIGARTNPAHFDSPQMTRIQELANLIRYLGSLHYRLKGILVMHWHGDHTIDVPVLLKALTNTSARVRSVTDNGYAPHSASIDPAYPALDYCVPVIVDAYTYSNYITAGGGDGGYNPATHYVVFQHPLCPACDEHDLNFTNGQRFNISGGLHDATGLVPCPDCGHGQFKLGHFEFNAYVWDHGTGNFGDDEWRTFAFRVWHDRAKGARRTFIVGSSGEMLPGFVGDSFFADHDGHSHRLHDLLRDVDSVYGDHFGGFIWTDMLIQGWANSDINSNLFGKSALALSTGDAVRFYVRNSGRDVGRNPVGYVLANHHDTNDDTDPTGSDRYTEMMAYLDFWGTRTGPSHWWKGEIGQVKVLGRQLQRTIVELGLDYWTSGPRRYSALLSDEHASGLFHNTGPDSDCDGVVDEDDNCPLTENFDQLDVSPADGIGDVCEGSQPGCVPPPSSMIAWWRFDDPSTHFFFDSVGTSHAHTNIDSGPVRLPTSTHGYVQGGLSFSGAGDFLRAPAKVNHDPSNMTIDAWVKIDPKASGRLPIIEWGRQNFGNTLSYTFYVDSDGTLGFVDRCRNASSNDYFTAPGRVIKGEWTHVAVSHTQDISSFPPKPGPLRFFINGKPVAGKGCATGACPPGTPTAALLDSVDLAACRDNSPGTEIYEWRIGAQQMGTPAFFDGVLDEIEIMQCALDQTGLYPIVAAGRAGKCKGYTPGTPPIGAMAAACHQAIGTAILKTVKSELKSIAKCRLDDAQLPGSCSQPMLVAGLTKVENKLKGTIDKYAGGVCSAPPPDLGFRNCACAGPIPISTYADVKDCAVCTVQANVTGLVDAVLGSITGPLNQSSLYCYASLTKAVSSTAPALMSIKALDFRNSTHVIVNSCPAANLGGSSPSAVLKFQKVTAKLDTQLQSTCSGPITQETALAAARARAVAACTSLAPPELVDCATSAVDSYSTALAAAAFTLGTDPDPPAVCGDGVVSTGAGESCDPPFDFGGAPGCAPGCTSTCGDGVVDTALGEACDDGPGNSDVSANACRSDCLPARCGDGVVDAGEACDDGNASNVDPCPSDCLAATCGDGNVCSAPSCTSGPAGGPEQCEPGPGTPGCAADCSNHCGNGITEPALGEACDAGPANSDVTPNACRSDCRTAHCLDGVVDIGEACDPGPSEKGDPRDPGACLDTCVLASCGDGFVCSNPGCVSGGGSSEDCDPPFASGGAPGCASTCVSTCGDGVVDVLVGETCDTAGATAICDDDCTGPACGDGVWNSLAGEGCDDGNLTSGDGCSATCTPESCACGGGSQSGSPCLPNAIPPSCPGGACVCS